MTPTVTDQVSDAKTILLGAPSMGSESQGTCIDLLTQDTVEEVSVLWVSFRKPPGDCLAEWRAHHDTDPGTFGVVAVGDTAESGGGDDDVDPAAVETIANPSDLTGIGITIGEFISGHGSPLAVCFDSLTALLQYVDLETAYEFLHALTGKLYTANAVSHFHIDPTAHDRETIDTILSLCDAMVDLRGEELETRSRYPLE